MADNNRHGRQLNNTKQKVVYGNTALELNAAIEKAPTHEPWKRYQGEDVCEQRMHRGFSNLVALVASCVVLGLVLVSYIKLRSDISVLNDDISRYETQLNNLTLENDDEYSKMVNAVDFDEIRRIAIEELGMTYASEDQIVLYERENSDYVRQVNSLTN